MTEMSALFAFQVIPASIEILALIGFLIYAVMIVAGLAVVIAIWRGMKAHEKVADSMARLAESTERIEKIIRRDQAWL
jgi:hypothetical protein